MQSHIKIGATFKVISQPITNHVVIDQYWTLVDYVDAATTQDGAHILRCLPRLTTESWCKEQLELFPGTSWRPTTS